MGLNVQYRNFGIKIIFYFFQKSNGWSGYRERIIEKALYRFWAIRLYFNCWICGWWNIFVEAKVPASIRTFKNINSVKHGQISQRRVMTTIQLIGRNGKCLGTHKKHHIYRTSHA